MMMRGWYGQGRRKKEEEQGTECQGSERGLGHRERYLINGGYRGTTSGHAVCYHSDSVKTYVFAVWNLFGNCSDESLLK